MVTYTKPQHRKKEESEQLRRERDKIKFIYLRFERWQVVGLRKARRSIAALIKVTGPWVKWPMYWRCIPVLKVFRNASSAPIPHSVS